jgi:hypothetical protein
VDFGLRKLFVAAPAANPPTIEHALEVDGGDVEDVFKAFHTRTQELRALDVDTWEAEGLLLRRCEAWFRDCFAAAAAQLLSYLDRTDADVVALEDTCWTPSSLAEQRHKAADPAPWVLPTCQQRLAEALKPTEYRVRLIEPEGTTTRCHCCGEEGARTQDGFRCHNEECPVTLVDDDRGAAVTVARRAKRRAVNQPPGEQGQEVSESNA